MIRSSTRLWTYCCRSLLLILITTGSYQGLFAQAQQKALGQKKDKQSSFNKIFNGQPGKAALYSLILPGAGQVYNRSYWKVPLVWAGEGYAIYDLTQRIQRFNQFNACHLALASGELDNPICSGETNVSNAFNNSQATRSDKETAWIIVGVAHLLNVFDAFVHRHLINFDTKDDISITVDQQSSWHSPHFTLARIRIPLN